MQIEQNEVYEKVWTMFISGVFQTTRGRHCFFYFFRFKKYISGKKSHHVFKTSMEYLWTEYAEFWFFHHVPLFYDFARS